MRMKSIDRKKLMREMWFFLVSGVVVGLDQLSKYLVRANIDPGQSVPEHGFFRFTYGTNTGGVFGFFVNQTFLITVAAVISVVVIILYSRHKMAQSMLVKVSLGMILGGSIGNLIDRIRFGAVTDFIDVGAWPVFNLADSAIDIGVVLLIIYILFRMKKDSKESKRFEPED
jgi:signal peptidase II